MSDITYNPTKHIMYESNLDDWEEILIFGEGKNTFFIVTFTFNMHILVMNLWKYTALD